MNFQRLHRAGLFRPEYFLLLLACLSFSFRSVGQCTIVNHNAHFNISNQVAAAQSFQATCSNYLLSVQCAGSIGSNKPSLVEVRSGDAPDGQLLYSNDAPAWTTVVINNTGVQEFTHTLSSLLLLDAGQTYTVVFVFPTISNANRLVISVDNSINSGQWRAYQGEYGSGQWIIVSPDYDLYCKFVIDECAPAFTACPTNPGAFTSSNACSAVVNYTATASGGIPPTLSYTFSGATTGSGSGTGSGSSFNKGVTNVTITATNVCGTQTCTFTVTVTDNVPPYFSNCPGTLFRNANANCQSTIPDYLIGGITASDNCSVVTTTQSPPAGTIISGTTTVTLTGTDAANNQTTCSFYVVIKDVTAPSIACPANTTVSANASCGGAIGAYSPTSMSDNCNPSPAFSQSPWSTTFLNGHNASQLVTLTASDGNGNTNTCTFTVTLKDVTAPSIACPANTTVAADASCNGTLGAYSPVSKSDNCNPSPAVTQSPASSTILSGHNTTQLVTLTASDGNGNTSSCTFTVTLKDATAPSIACPANTTVSANTSCGGAIGAYSPTSMSDNCNPNPSFSQSPSSTTFLNGHNASQLVTLTASDGNGNTNTCTFTVTLKDVTAPGIACPANTTVSADASCSGTLGAYSPVSKSDNCNPSPAVTQSPASSTILSGHNTTQLVTLTASDGNGNTSSCTFTVTLKDATAPSIACPANTTVSANASCGGAIGAYSPTSMSDNCNPSPAFSQSPSSTTFLNGHNASQVVTLTTSDGNGNTNTCTFTVTLKDVTAPGIACPANTTVSADASCNGTLGAYSPVSKSDNCNPNPSFSQSPSSTTFLNGHNATQLVTLTASDGNGNTSSCTFTVTLKDATAPSIACPANTTVSANASCGGAIGAYSPTSMSDNCNPNPTFSQSPSSTTFLNGHNASQLVTLTASDGNGNTNTCTFTVTLKDVTAPGIACPANTTIAAGVSCNGTLGAYSPVSKSDNCNPNPAVTQSPAASTILNGHNATQIVTLIASDGNGNTSSCTFTVTLKDVTAPSIACPANTTVSAGVSCSGTLGAYSPISKSDNCNPNPAVTQSPAASTILNGHNTTQLVSLSASDGNGNTSSCTFTVTLKDVTPPSVSCKVTNISLNASGTANITPGDVFQSGSDNCGTVNLVSVSPNTFNCSNLGLNTITLSANDGNGNTAGCSVQCKVIDALSPNALCKNATINLGANGSATLTPAQVDNGSNDNCSISNLSLSQTNFSCANVGNNLVTLTAKDPSNNTGTCQATVTVKDPIIPVAHCKNATVLLGANGTVNVPAAAINNGSSDNCSLTLSVTPATLSCANVGLNIVTLIATDGGGNTATCTATVTLQDKTAPSALCKNINVYLDDNGEASINAGQVNNGSSDNCAIASMSIDNSQFDCGQIGGSPISVVLTVKDIYNNQSTCIASVSVKDAIAPTAVCQDVTVQLNAQGKATVYGADLASNSFDNCSVWSYSPIAKVYTTANLGVNNLNITVKDFDNNGSVCVSKVTVIAYGFGNRDASGEPGEYPDGTLDMKVFPNPTEKDINLSFRLPEAQHMQLRLLDARGRLALARNLEGKKDENNWTFELNDLAPGLYILDLRSENFKGTMRVVLQR